MTVVLVDGVLVNGLLIQDMPDLGAVTDGTSLVGYRAGAGRFLAPALATYLANNPAVTAAIAAGLPAAIAAALPSAVANALRLAPPMNFLVNGDCTLDQINEGGVYAVPSNGDQTTAQPDCWDVSGYTAASGITLQRVHDGPLAFINSIQITVGTGAPVSRPNDGLILFQNLCGQQIGIVGYGTSGAIPTCVSFWIKSHGVTGTYCFAMQDGTAGRGFVTNFTVPTADVWQFIQLQIPADSFGAGYAPVTLFTSASTASGHILPFASTAGILVGSNLSGTNIKPGTFINSFTPTSVELGQNILGPIASGSPIVFTPPWIPSPENSIQATFTITLAAGVGWQGVADQWQTTPPIGAFNGGSAPISTPQQTAQLVTVSGAYVRLTGMTFQPGTFPSWQQEEPASKLAKARQFTQKSYPQGVAVGTPGALSPVTWSQQSTGTFAIIQSIALDPMLLQPSTVTIYSATTGAVGMAHNSMTGTDIAMTVILISSTNFIVQTAEFPQVAGGFLQFHWAAETSH